jgi:hypothetical protein
LNQFGTNLKKLRRNKFSENRKYIGTKKGWKGPGEPIWPGPSFSLRPSKPNAEPVHLSLSLAHWQVGPTCQGCHPPRANHGRDHRAVTSLPFNYPLIPAIKTFPDYAYLTPSLTPLIPLLFLAEPPAGCSRISRRRLLLPPAKPRRHGEFRRRLVLSLYPLFLSCSGTPSDTLGWSILHSKWCQRLLPKITAARAAPASPLPLHWKCLTSLITRSSSPQPAAPRPGLHRHRRPLEHRHRRPPGHCATAPRHLWRPQVTLGEDTFQI